MNGDLLIAAFELAITAHDTAGQEGAMRSLQKRFPETDRKTVTEAFLVACRLRKYAYDLADRHRDGIYTEAQALAILQERCPEFSPQTYRRAFAQGLHESR